MHCKGLWLAGRLGAHPNWIGDWIRYSSFALASGRPVSFLLVAFIASGNYSSRWVEGRFKKK